MNDVKGFKWITPPLHPTSICVEYMHTCISKSRGACNLASFGLCTQLCRVGKGCEWQPVASFESRDVAPVLTSGAAALSVGAGARKAIARDPPLRAALVALGCRHAQRYSRPVGPTFALSIVISMGNTVCALQSHRLYAARLTLLETCPAGPLHASRR